MDPGIDLQGDFIRSLMDLGIPPGTAKALWMPLPMLLMIVAATVGVLVTTWLERKVSAAVQQRIGPEYAGPFGVLIPVADGLKLIFKEDIVPIKADPWLFTLGPVLVVLPVLLAFLIVPFGQQLVISNLGIGIFLWIALSSVVPIGLLMSGYASNNKYSLLGGLRAAAAERLPFDLPEAEEELVAGYQTEYAGMKFALFYLGSYMNLVLSGLLISVLYLGGWSFPIPVEQLAAWLRVSETAPWLEVVTASLGITMTVLKAYFFVFLAVLLRWTVPRVRIDQLLDLGWKFLLPVSLANLLITAGLKLALPAAFGG